MEYIERFLEWLFGLELGPYPSKIREEIERERNEYDRRVALSGNLVQRELIRGWNTREIVSWLDLQEKKRHFIETGEWNNVTSK